ncbi:hypothetical protein NOC27_67 [Nitrosococcus oceani AFC27]|nr:HNH endonuclease family protein [Nitrosococcus oceani]EDZ66740.1 hypothetical protein NOC27_67 [Nitrosococcus oceani AFC27]GEM21747.1 hypothetical protein [Nitrosococcus oceani]
MLILDGQQRLQSLFIGLKGSYEKKELYFDILSGESAAPEDVRYRFRFLSNYKAVFPWICFKEIVFYNGMPNRLADEVIAKADRELSDNDIARTTENVWKAIQMFVQHEALSYQELDSVDNPDAYTENDIVEIFIRANSGGTKLGKSDLLFSLLTSSWEDSDERMEELLDELNRPGYHFTRDFVLKTCLTLLGKGASYDIAKFRDGRTREAIIERWDEISAAISDVKDFLQGKTFIRTDRALPSYLGLIPIIYFRFKFPGKWGNISNLDSYILQTLLTGSFGGRPDTLIDKCTRRIDEISDFDVTELFGVIRADGRSLEVTRDTILNTRYSSKDIHLLFNLWYRDFNYQPAYENNLPQVDHIFPQSLLKTVKDENPETGRRNILRYKTGFRDQIANCMLLRTQENGAGGKSDALPMQWFRDKDDEYLDLHLIPKDKTLWELDRFEDFIEARKRLILEKFQYLLQ